MSNIPPWVVAAVLLGLFSTYLCYGIWSTAKLYGKASAVWWMAALVWCAVVLGMGWDDVALLPAAGLFVAGVAFRSDAGRQYDQRQWRAGLEFFSGLVQSSTFGVFVAIRWTARRVAELWRMAGRRVE